MKITKISIMKDFNKKIIYIFFIINSHKILYYIIINNNIVYKNLAILLMNTEFNSIIRAIIFSYTLI